MTTKSLRDQIEELPSWRTSWLFWGVVLLALPLFGASLNIYHDVQNVSTTLNSQIASLERRRAEDLNRRAQLTNRLEHAESASAETRNQLATVANRLNVVRTELQNTRQHTQDLRVDLSQRLTALNTSVQTELATKAAADDLKQIDTKVASVRSDLEANRENLSMARSEMGTLIARNHDEIDQLRRMTERDYFEFTLGLKDGRTKVGGISMQLRSTDAKRNHFSVDLYLDDKQVRKQDRNGGEPIYFYASGSRSPLELVINQVTKESISGYLSAPRTPPTP